MTIDFLAGFYLWTKSLHVISLIAWMAGLYTFLKYAKARLGS